MISVNTNSGAMIALQYLNKTNSQLMTTQNAINTGLSVSSAKDNGAVFAIAQNMRGDVASYTSVQDSLGRGVSSVDVALSAGQSISDLLIEMKQKALSAADASLEDANWQLAKKPSPDGRFNGVDVPGAVSDTQHAVELLNGLLTSLTNKS